MSELPTIVGICGDIGSGKDTAADGLIHRLGYRKIALADALKEAVAIMFPWIPRRHFFGTQEEKAQLLFVGNGGIGWSGRSLLEEIGTEKIRSILDDVWIRALMYRIDAAPPGTRWVIPDVRFPNEFEEIWGRGGVVWEVVREGGPPIEASGHVSNHAWRLLAKDATLRARWGDMEALQDAARALAMRGGRN